MRKDVPTVKILVGYHKPAVLLKDDVLTPIHLGRAVATENSKDGKISEEDYKWMLDNMIGDDTGDNISHLNRQFCEMTGIYWAWKNYDKLGNPDYIGFMHYRRHFNFNTLSREFAENQYFYTSIINEKYKLSAGLDADSIRKSLNDYDVICPSTVKHTKSVLTSFYDLAKKLDLSTDIFDMFIKHTKNINPCMKRSVEKYLRDKLEIPCNMFVMKKELFFNLAEMLFPVIFATEKHVNYNEMSINGKRILAYSAEKFLASYITMLKQARIYKIKNLPISKTRDIDSSSFFAIYPAFNQNNVPVVYSSDDNYAAYTAVSIKSLIANFSQNKNLDIIILDDGISDENKKLILSLKTVNSSIRFINMESFIQDQKFYVHGHFTRAAYYRVYIAKLLTNYDRVLYFDGDTIILKDISELFEDIEFKYNELIAATQAINPLHSALKGNYLKVKEMPLIDYWKNILKLSSPLCYFNTGIMLMNLKEMRKVDFESKFFRKLDEIQDPPGVDQDIFNALASEKVIMFSQKWNFMGYGDHKNFDKWLPGQIASDFYSAQKDMSIIHYASKNKPWDNPEMVNAFYFWKYARETPFYETILYKKDCKIISGYNKNCQSSNKTRKRHYCKSLYWLKYVAYRFICNLTFGAVRTKMMHRKQKYKNKFFES